MSDAAIALVSDSAQARAALTPIRRQLLEHLRKPGSAASLAQELGVAGGRAGLDALRSPLRGQEGVELGRARVAGCRRVGRARVGLVGGLGRTCTGEQERESKRETTQGSESHPQEMPWPSVDAARVDASFTAGSPKRGIRH